MIPGAEAGFSARSVNPGNCAYSHRFVALARHSRHTTARRAPDSPFPAHGVRAVHDQSRPHESQGNQQKHRERLTIHECPQNKLEGWRNELKQSQRAQPHPPRGIPKTHQRNRRQYSRQSQKRQGARLHECVRPSRAAGLPTHPRRGERREQESLERQSRYRSQRRLFPN